ncbi:hypothetical protein MZD04_gp041 [Pseudomonas phage Psa21]|uniref:Uncharacterized protein n=1 Tax=Pseudomonas phage Psa21 TaxID=2530023 RepID=A0A481W4F0_9CAUD|nr:hypothetical protein MZD04_gp041 [Pseudomonas phage Psa21]QBJ02571.1 hypothetical protein PSA21_41 [Pseudomonas phage Psa21]
MDDIIEWVLEANTHYQQTGEILKLHHVPRLTSYNKLAMEYERLFLTMAIALWQKLPNTVSEVFPVNMHGKQMYFLITFIPVKNDVAQPEVVVNLTIDQFLRPSKKIRGRKQDMNSIAGTP